MKRRAALAIDTVVIMIRKPCHRSGPRPAVSQLAYSLRTPEPRGDTPRFTRFLFERHPTNNWARVATNLTDSSRGFTQGFRANSAIRTLRG
jgi:hypothetical protein